MSQQDDHGGLWVFGYGSLMWNPGFEAVSAVPARLDGFHRAFCVYSIVYRGRPERPGLVLGLDRGGTCHGMAFKVAPERARETLSYLRGREQLTGVYRETVLPLRLRSRRNETVSALTFVVERQHPGYAGRLPLGHQARLIRAASGIAGSNIAYAMSTLDHLSETGVEEPRLERLATLLGARFRRTPECTAESLTRMLAHHPPGAPQRRPDQRRRFLYRNHLAARFDSLWPEAK